MKLSVILILLTIASNAWSQLNPPVFDHITRMEGLPENYTQHLVQDKLGYLWITTQKGVIRYDGHSMTKYKFESKNGLGGGRKMYLDKSGTLWIDGYFNLHRYNPQADAFDKINPPIADSIYKYSYMYNLTKDAKGNTWGTSILITSHTFVIEKIAKGSLQSTLYTDTLELGLNDKKSEYGPTVFADREGRLWLSTFKGLFQYNDDTQQFKNVFKNRIENLGFDLKDIQEFSAYPGSLWFVQKVEGKANLVRYNPDKNTAEFIPLQPNSKDTTVEVNQITDDQSGNIWLATSDGLFHFKPSTHSIEAIAYPDNMDLPDKTCHQIVIGKHNRIWASTGSGLFILLQGKNQLEAFGNNELQEMILEDIVYLFLDNINGLWATTARKGLLHLNRSKSQFVQLKEQDQSIDFPDERIHTIAIDPKTGVVYCTTGGKLFASDLHFKKFSTIALPEKIGTITCMFPDQGGNLWLGTESEGVFWYDTETRQFKKLGVDVEQVSSQLKTGCTSLLLDSKKRLWVGTNLEGICYYDLNTEKWTTFPYSSIDKIESPDSGILDNRKVLKVYEDRLHNIFVGTNIGGINRYNEATGLFHSSTLTYPELVCIPVIYQDPNNRYWAGSYLSGVTLFDPEFKSFKKITEQEGLISNNVLSMHSDTTDHLWIITDIGISVLNPTDFSIRNFTYKNGLPKEEIKYLEQTGDFPDGAIIFATQNDLVRFFPDELTLNTDPPITILESIKFNSRKEGASRDSFIRLQNTTLVTLPHYRNRITFNYTGIHFMNPELISFKHMLVGLDKDWIQSGTLRSTTYNNLSPGKYTFKVLAANSDGVWAEKPASVKITIRPPWWKSMLAYVIYFLLFLFIGKITYQVQKRRLLDKQRAEAREKELAHAKEIEKAYHDLEVSHENLKATQAQLIQSEKMASLGELTAGIAHEIQNPLNFVNNFSEVSKELLDELKVEFKDGNLEEVTDIADDLTGNLDKIAHHGKRAEEIVKGMLLHSRGSSGQTELTDLNSLADEYLRLSYHGYRAKNKSFNADFELVADQNMPNIKVVPQDIGRVFLNIMNNAFYAVAEKAAQSDKTYKPSVKVTSRLLPDKVEISVRDNGNGIAQETIEKIFQPFFTTKPTGKGTGLGLSLSYDIIKSHGGNLMCKSQPDEGAEFIISIPLQTHLIT